MKHHKHLEIDTDYRDTKNPTTAEISHKKKDFGYKHRESSNWPLIVAAVKTKNLIQS